MKLLEVEGGHVPRCPIVGNTTGPLPWLWILKLVLVNIHATLQPGMRSPCFFSGNPTPTPGLGNLGLQTPTPTAKKKPGLLQLRSQNQTLTPTLGIIL